MASAAVFGCTGLVGSYILSNLLASESSLFATVHTISRRQPKSEGPALRAIVEADSSKWTTELAAIKPPPTTVFSALGTTRAQAGGIQAQWKIDHDLNVELVQAAKAAGTKNFVFISSTGIGSPLAGWAPYSKMKLGVENAIEKAGFEHAVIVRPGIILGEREVPHQGGPLLNSVARGLGRWCGMRAQDKIGQEGEVIARAAIQAARLVEEGKAPSKVWVLSASDIVRLGRTEWKG